MSRSSTRLGLSLARRRFSEGLEGITRLHALIAGYLHDPSGPGESVPQIGWKSRRSGVRGRRRWSPPAIGCSRPTRCRRPGIGSGTRRRRKSDAGDAHILAEVVRLDRDYRRQVACDSAPGPTSPPEPRRTSSPCRVALDHT